MKAIKWFFEHLLLALLVGGIVYLCGAITRDKVSENAELLHHIETGITGLNDKFDAGLIITIGKDVN